MATAEGIFIHPTAIVAGKVGPGTKIWQFSIVLEGAQIGSECNIGSHCFVESDVLIGDRVTIKNGVSVWDGLRISDDVFVGPGVVFTNDKYPVSRSAFDSPATTEIGRGTSVGAGAVLLPGVRIGSGCLIGAGAVVTRDIPPNSVAVGNPAEVVKYLNKPFRETKFS